MEDPNQQYQLYSMAAPGLGVSTSAQAPQVQTYRHIIDMKEMLRQLMMKVEVLEHKKPVLRYDEPIGRSHGAQTSLLVTEQIEKMAKEQGGYLASTQQAVTDVLRTQQHAGIEITRINESLRYGYASGSIHRYSS